MYYVYQHRKADSNEIFYVGKGKGKRLTGTQGRNKYWKHTVAKHGYVAEIVKDNLDEEFALLIEMELIDTYRKRGINLVNLTNGGEGLSGYSRPVSEKTKKILSEKAMGRPGCFKSEHFTEEMRQAIVNSNKRRKMTKAMKEKTEPDLILVLSGLFFQGATENGEFKLGESVADMIFELVPKNL